LEERAQALVRIGIVVAALVFFGGLTLIGSEDRLAGYRTGMLAAAVAFVYALIWLQVVHARIGPDHGRRVVAIFIDLAFTSLATYIAGDLGVFTYPLYLWIIVGHGIRFGPRNLVIAAAVGVSGFCLVLGFSDYWRDNLVSGLGLLLGLVVLPSYFWVLLRRLYATQDLLATELEASVHAATHDSLTGLVNRDYFVQRIAEDVQRARRYREGFAILFIDLDGFKAINDALGHHCGDEALREIGKRLHDIARASDLSARLGGDEFALLVRDIRQCAELEELADRLLAELGRPLERLVGPARLSASIGIALFPGDGTDCDALLRAADRAMYDVKAAGKNGWRCASD
jgi:diguanylate cyclase (GGDEF)-like protein